jgi:hypothetical protein
LRKVLSRRQLQGFVIPPRIVTGFQLRSPGPGSAAPFKSFKSRSTKPAPRRALYQTLKSRAALLVFKKGTRDNAGLQLRRAISIQAERKKLLEKHAIAPSAATLCWMLLLTDSALNLH